MVLTHSDKIEIARKSLCYQYISLKCLLISLSDEVKYSHKCLFRAFAAKNITRAEPIEIKDKERTNMNHDMLEFSGMSENSYSRPSQIPIRMNRYVYLTTQYTNQDNSDWMLVNSSAHFIIYNKVLKACVFDATYEILKPIEEMHEEDIVAVVTSICINSNAIALLGVEDDFGLLAKLIEKLLWLID